MINSSKCNFDINYFGIDVALTLFGSLLNPELNFSESDKANTKRI